MVNDQQLNDMISAWSENRYNDVDFPKIIWEIKSLLREVHYLKGLVAKLKDALQDEM